MSSPRARATAAADVPGGRRELHTFRGNLKSTRHGWLRLTPAYSVRLVDGLLEDGCAGPVLDPFCGTGTTLLSCSEHGIDGDSVDINPFLVWLARSKVARYSTAHVEEARRGLGRMRRAARGSRASGWVPPLHQIEKWWWQCETDDTADPGVDVSHSGSDRYGHGAGFQPLAVPTSARDARGWR